MIKSGSKCPLFTLKNQDGIEFNIESVLAKKNIVIFFYPKDDTPGCVREACYFRDQYEVFQKSDTELIGISGQSVESHKKFAKKYKLIYTLLSDPNNLVRKEFGVPAKFFGLLPGRVTFIVDKTGHIIHTFDSQFEATKHIDVALRILTSL